MFLNYLYQFICSSKQIISSIILNISIFCHLYWSDLLLKSTLPPKKFINYPPFDTKIQRWTYNEASLKHSVSFSNQKKKLYYSKMKNYAYTCPQQIKELKVFVGQLLLYLLNSYCTTWPYFTVLCNISEIKIYFFAKKWK